MNLKQSEKNLESWNERLREEVEQKTRALRESQQFLQSVMDSIPDVIKIVD